MPEPAAQLRHYCPECRMEQDFELSAVLDDENGDKEAVYVCPGCHAPPRPGMRTTTLARDEDGNLMSARSGRHRLPPGPRRHR